MITDYEVITATHISDLQERVRERVKANWQPIGGVAVMHEENAGLEKPHMVFAQAVVLTATVGTTKRRVGAAHAAPK